MTRHDRGRGGLPRRRSALPLAGSAACFGGVFGFALLAYAEGPAARFDSWLLGRAVSGAEGSAALGPARFLVHLGDPVPVLAAAGLACAGALVAERPREAAGALVVVAGASATTLVLKGLLAHVRFDPVPLAHPIVADAYPSGHATGLASAALALSLAAPFAWRPPVVAFSAGVAILASICLVALGHHFPSDVVGGWLVAGGWFCAVVAALRAAEALPGPDTLTE